MEYFHSLKLQFAVDGAGNKIMNVFHRELTIVSPTWIGRRLYSENFFQKVSYFVARVNGD